MISALANHLWQSTLFALAAGLLTIAFRRHHARVRYCLWLAASIKFLIPFSLLISLGAHWARIAGSAGDFVTAPQLSLALAEVSVPFSMQVANKASTADASTLANFVLVLVPLLWLTGTLCITFVWLRRWTRIRKIVRAGFPVELGLPVRTMSTGDYPEPAVFGIIRPVLLLPRGITERLTPPELKAIVAHELCHIRWRDNAAAAVHMLTKAAFWFHPLVWWIGSRLVDERERACDEEVVRISGDPFTYAESLVKVCEYYLESRIACVAGVTGSNLKQRIEAVAGNRTARRLNTGRKLLLTAAALTAVVIPILVGLTHAPRLSAQPQSSGPRSSFEVASVKLSKSGAPAGDVQLTPGRFRGRDLALQWLILVAYRLRSYQLAGNLPGWTLSEKYDIDATTEKTAGDDQVLQMLKVLLEDRFQLRLHRETKEGPVYFLVAAKGGIKMKPGTCVPAKQDYPNECWSQGGDGLIQTLDWRGVSMSTPEGVGYRSLSWQLSMSVGRTVIDRTGLTEGYDVHLRWARDTGDVADTTAPSLFTALEEQLGLRLEPGRGPVEQVIIDHMEKPTAN